ncbi:MAG: hypothetical protein PHO75_02370 [Candidatus Shapirobacteria bacterium]|nr:hypothetical protein [Candidatus Shapirobacteria bacterium]
MKLITKTIKNQQFYDIPNNFGTIKTLKIDGKYKRFTIYNEILSPPVISKRSICLARVPKISGLEIIINVELINA